MWWKPSSTNRIAAWCQRGSSRTRPGSPVSSNARSAPSGGAEAQDGHDPHARAWRAPARSRTRIARTESDTRTARPSAPWFQTSSVSSGSGGPVTCASALVVRRKRPIRRQGDLRRDETRGGQPDARLRRWRCCRRARARRRRGPRGRRAREIEVVLATRRELHIAHGGERRAHEQPQPVPSGSTKIWTMTSLRDVVRGKVARRPRRGTRRGAAASAARGQRSFPRLGLHGAQCILAPLREESPVPR